MFDIKWIKENPDTFNDAMRKRDSAATASQIVALDEARKEHIGKLQEAQTRRNSASKEIGAAMGAGDMELAEKLKSEVAAIKTFLAEGEEEERRINSELRAVLSAIPNMPLEDVPEGADENDNTLYREHDEKPALGFEAKEHFELGEALGQMDFEGAAALSGSRFVILKKDIAKLERALGQFMLDMHTR